MCSFCASVPAPLMPELAFTEFPPSLHRVEASVKSLLSSSRSGTRIAHEGFLSSKITVAPFSSAVCAALKPARPPPTTIVRRVDIAAWRRYLANRRDVATTDRDLRKVPRVTKCISTTRGRLRGFMYHEAQRARIAQLRTCVRSGPNLDEPELPLT